MYIFSNFQNFLMDDLLLVESPSPIIQQIRAAFVRESPYSHLHLLEFE